MLIDRRAPLRYTLVTGMGKQALGATGHAEAGVAIAQELR
jgi:hypothetical protein